ncbi:MAG: ribonuclease J [Ruminococcus sp.]|nr:ribonuclease J [Candidatus Apopatosoma intestinale]
MAENKTNKQGQGHSRGEDRVDRIIESVLTSRVDGSKLSISDISPDIKLPPRRDDGGSAPYVPKKKKTQREETKPALEKAPEQPPKKKPIPPRKKRLPEKKSVTDLTGIAPQTAAAPVVSVPVTDKEKQPKKNGKMPQQGGKLKKLRVISLGGVGEIGKNLTVLEYSDNMLIIDCGIGFPDEDMPGIDSVVPDITYLVNNKEKIKGIVITHGHEDHIGAVPYVLEKLDVPVYATRLTLGILESKLEEHTLPFKPQLNCVSAGQKVRLGLFDVEFIRVNHSIADAVCLAIRTPVGIVVHSGDFKIDTTPIDGEMTDLTRLGEIGREGVALLLCGSTNVERPGFTPSEKKVGQSLVRYFDEYKDKRIVISTFSSNVHRVQQIIDIAAAHGRKVAITGRSMLNVIGAAIKLGYMNVPSGVIVDISTIKNYPPEKMTIVSTGSQGEPMSALYRMAYNMHDKVELGPFDLVIISASAIPGNEKLVGNIINELYRKGVQVLTDTTAEVHVSGHACQEEIKIMHALTRPKYFMPIHGEARHLVQHKLLAEYMGMPPQNIFVSAETGKVLEIGTDGAKWSGTVPSGIVMIDGYGVGDVGNVVLRDRRLLSQDGLIVVCLAVDKELGELSCRPEVITRGFVYVKESEELLEELRKVAETAAGESLSRNHKDYSAVKNRVKEDVARYVMSKTKRKPMIISVIQ